MFWLFFEFFIRVTNTRPCECLIVELCSPSVGNSRCLHSLVSKTFYSYALHSDGCIYCFDIVSLMYVCNGLFVPTSVDRTKDARSTGHVYIRLAIAIQQEPIPAITRGYHLSTLSCTSGFFHYISESMD